MSPNNKIKLKYLRKKLDIIDNQLIKIIKKRTEIIKKVLLVKNHKNEIVDKKRINLILKRVGSKSRKMKANSKLIKSIWMDMIHNFIEYERKEFKKRK